MFIGKVPFLSNCLTKINFPGKITYISPKTCCKDDTKHNYYEIANRTPARYPMSEHKHISEPKNQAELPSVVSFALFCLLGF